MRIIRKVHLRILGLCFLISVCAVGVGAFLATPDTSNVEKEYDRITLGGGESFQGRIVCSDSITLVAGGNVQKSSRFEVISVKTQGNNGIATAIGSNSVYLNWASSPDGVVQTYTVYRSNSKDGTYEVVAVLGGTVLEYTDTGLNPATTYFYKVVALGVDSSSWTVLGPIGVKTKQVSMTPLAADGNWREYR
ncbi:MAG TPA: fibronectin type III domain-containing protein [bacterium]|nr:fibronectin type III domain-containing protein [bacterium]